MVRFIRARVGGLVGGREDEICVCIVGTYVVVIDRAGLSRKPIDRVGGWKWL